MNNKRGLSNIVATVLIVLLALAAVAVLATIIINPIERTGIAIDLRQKCFLTEVKPTSCTISGDREFAIVNVQLMKGEASQVVASIEEDSTGESVSRTEDAPNVLATTPININIENLGSTGLVAKAAAIQSDGKGNTYTCDVSTVTVACT